jgi:hypothetical protein
MLVGFLCCDTRSAEAAPNAQPGAQPGGPAEALEWLNEVRRVAGAPPTTLDATLSSDAAAHAAYLVLNRGKPALAGLRSHDEDMQLPGATPGGRASAAASNIGGGRSALVAVQDLMQVPLHRTWLLNPQLRRVGIGTAKYPDSDLYSVVVDVFRGIEHRPAPTERPLVYPAPGQAGVPLEFGGEIPDPRDATPGKGQRTGVAISVEPTCGTLSAPSRVQLREDKGSDLPFWVVNPGTAVSAVGGTRTVAQILVIPQRPLEAGTAHRVTVSGRCGGKEYAHDWMFTTVGRKLPRNERGEYEVRIPETMDFLAATNWSETYQPTQLEAGILLIVDRGAALPGDPAHRLGFNKLRVQMADSGPVDLRLLRPTGWIDLSGIQVTDYAGGPQFRAEVVRQQAGRWGAPLGPPSIESGAWVLRFPAGAEMRWMPGATAAIVRPPCEFQLGFASIRALIPSETGTCVEHENFNPANGNVEQRTSTGQMVWRKSDNWTAFTDGYQTWINGPSGLQRRLNTDRFDWES